MTALNADGNQNKVEFKHRKKRNNNILLEIIIIRNYHDYK